MQRPIILSELNLAVHIRAKNMIRAVTERMRKILSESKEASSEMNIAPRKLSRILIYNCGRVTNKKCTDNYLTDMKTTL